MIRKFNTAEGRPAAFTSIRPTRDGGYVVTGEAMAPSGYNDVLAAKLDAQFKIVWARTYGERRPDRTEYEERGYDIGELRDGGFVVMGTTNNTMGGDSMIVIKLDSAGNLLWAEIIRDIVGKAVAGGTVLPLANNGFLVAGQNDGAVMLASLDAHGNLSTDAHGNPLSKSFVNRSGIAYAQWTQRTRDGGFIMVGFNQEFDIPSNKYLDKNVLVLRLDANAKPLWRGIFGGPYLDAGNSIEQTRDGGFIVAGVSSLFDGNGESLMLRLDAHGNTTWKRSWPAGGDDRLGDFVQGISETRDGGFMAVGRTSQLNRDGIYDGIFLRLDRRGTLTSPQTLFRAAPGSADWLQTIVPTRDGFAVMGTADVHRPSFQDKPVLIKLDPEASIDEWECPHLVPIDQPLGDASWVKEITTVPDYDPIPNTRLSVQKISVEVGTWSAPAETLCFKSDRGPDK